MIVQVKDKETGKYLGYIAGYAISDSVAYVLVAKDGAMLEDYRMEELIVQAVIHEGAE